MPDALFAWPNAARVGRRVPKDKIYRHGKVPPLLREKFVAQVESVYWDWKLAETTINLPGDLEVPEIQIFTVKARSEDVDDSVLSAIDTAIPLPVIYEIQREGRGGPQVRATARFKVGGPQGQRSTYYSEGWRDAGSPRSTLPTAISLPRLYVALLEPLLPLELRPGESVSEVARRLALVQRLEGEYASLERRLRSESQFNRKVEIKRELTGVRAALQEERS